MKKEEIEKDEEYIVCCGGIQPIFLPDPEEEEEVCTEQF